MSFWKNVNVLVTGANGFTGSHITRELVRNGARVRALVKNGGMVSNLLDIRKKISIYSGDICDITSLFPAMEGVDYVFHPAAIVPVLEARQSPQACLQVNVLGSYNVAYAATKTGVKRMLHISTCHVYGNTKDVELPIKESVTPRPVDLYSASKYSAEICLRPFLDQDFPVIFTRAFAMYGPCQREQYFIPRVITQLLSGVVPRLGTPDSTRDYCFIEDVARGYLLALEKGIPGQVYHLSSQKEVVIGDIYKLIVRLMGKEDVEPQWNATTRTQEIMRLSGDSSKARKEFGWAPTIGLEDGLGRTIQWWRDHPQLWKETD
jgi:nucleoside-diphosphate-sugar epimerase